MRIKVVTHKENASLIKSLKIEAEVGEIEEMANNETARPIYKSLIRLLERVAGKDKENA